MSGPVKMPATVGVWKAERNGRELSASNPTLITPPETKKGTMKIWWFNFFFFFCVRLSHELFPIV